VRPVFLDDAIHYVDRIQSHAYLPYRLWSVRVSGPLVAAVLPFDPDVEVAALRIGIEQAALDAGGHAVEAIGPAAVKTNDER
jgi:hypothetical protein